MNDKHIITRFLIRNYPKDNKFVGIYSNKGENGKRVSRAILELGVTSILGYRSSSKINNVVDDYLLSTIP